MKIELSPFNRQLRQKAFQRCSVDNHGKSSPYVVVGSERIELSIFAMSRQRHKPLDHEP